MLQTEYAKYTTTLKEISLKENLEKERKEQMTFINEYKNKYKLYVKSDNSITLINWNKVEKLIMQSIG